MDIAARLAPLALAFALAIQPSAQSQDAPRLPLDPPPAARPGPGDGEQVDRAAGDLARRLFDARPTPFDQADVAGLPPGSNLPLLTWERAYRLAMIRARAEPPIRFETLDPGRLDAEAARLGLDDFARFRAEFVAARALRDPAADFLDLQVRLVRIEDARAYLARVERWTEVLKELINGEASGLGQIDLDLSNSAAIAARRDLGRLVGEYRDRLDEFKVALGLAPRAAVAVDLAPLQAFRDTFAAIDRWGLGAKRELSDLNAIVGQLPPPGDLVIGGRPILEALEQGEDRLDGTLTLATRVALGNRHERDEPADAVELRARRRVRRLAEIRQEYVSELRSIVLAARLVDTAFEQIIAPPAGAVPRPGGPATASLIEAGRQLVEHRGRAVALWAGFQAERLAADRDLGLVIAPDWPAFLARFTARPRPADAAGAATTAPAVAPAPPGPPPLGPPDPPLPPPVRP